jgi:uncharacterized protein (DUF433 family)
MSVAVYPSDPLLRGVYTLTEAARLLRIGNKQRISRWLGGENAVIIGDYDPIGGSQELSFWDLFEVRFVETFRAQGFSLQYLRKVAAKARLDFDTTHPFALSCSKYMTDRKRIFQITAQEDGEETHEIFKRQHEMYEVVERSLAKGVEFNPRSLLVEEWAPLPECPSVTINPRYAYGQPAIGDKRVPTAALYRLFKAEGRVERVAAWYGTTITEAADAIDFEVRLAA